MSDVLLAIDTATEQCSVALSYQGKVYTRSTLAPREHSQKILGFVTEVLSEAGIGLEQVDGIVCGHGPGSFTGVRIGVSVAQGLAFSHTLPVYPVCTLAALAQQVARKHGAATVVSAIDARMQEVYLACYAVTATGVTELVAPQMAALSDLSQAAWWPQGALVGAGTGWQAYAAELDPNRTVNVLEDVTLPLAEDMLLLAAQTQPVPAEELEPLYVRNEVTWQKLPGR
ncbi:tRNA (adenosine(37)-N6)-threonylcarbamoyltransferase complex dimerization subunit type 1 TsaB [Pseudidiomarina salilacus]|uniref:tRNA (adenosine(37)-N6)-threonylcarbamoyltransferase complex dimerization subunit type 1 TsaB n=1 Tax=Pseudidiomarina salilacus TaxID=3384452 RepID=UPI003985692A